MVHFRQESLRRVRHRLVQVTTLWLAVGLPCVARLCAETPPKPSARIPLKDLGFSGYPVSLLHAGASMATVHALDATHILFTYSMRSLVPRLPGDNANDTDRQVAAVLVDLPTGKVLARTTWHLHDHARYLWSVGRGVFVVRIGGDLSVIAPLQGLEKGEEPLRRYALPHRPGQPVLVDGAPDGKVIMVESETNRTAALGDDEIGGRKPKHYTMEFFRLAQGGAGETPLLIQAAGAVGSPVLLRLPMDGDGYLWAEDNHRGNWTVSFNEFNGKQQKLTSLASSCHPRLTLLSRSQFLVETCRGSDQQPLLAAYGFDGHENWQEPFGEALQPPTLALSPELGRFAMSRLVASSSGAANTGIVGDSPITQELRIYQTESGDMLLHVLCAPAVRSAENFDLSPDGRSLVVLGPETIDFYKLPELTAKDRKDLAEVQAMTPPEGSGPVTLAKITRPVQAPDSVDGGDAVRARDEVSPAAGTSTVSRSVATTSASAAAPSASPKEPVAVVGDPAATGTARKAPTLLNPGESPDFKGQSSTPK